MMVHGLLLTLAAKSEYDPIKVAPGRFGVLFLAAAGCRRDWRLHGEESALSEANRSPHATRHAPTG